MTRQEAAAIARELHRYNARLDDLSEQTTEMITTHPDDEVVMLVSIIIEALLSIAANALAETINIVRAVHCIDDQAPPRQEGDN